MKKKLCLCLAIFVAPVSAMPVRSSELKPEQQSAVIFQQQQQQQVVVESQNNSVAQLDESARELDSEHRVELQSFYEHEEYRREAKQCFELICMSCGFITPFFSTFCVAGVIAIFFIVK